MYQDYKDLLSAFQSHGVKYLVVGGFAVIYHSQPRFTKDMDVFIKADPANAQATYAALESGGQQELERESVAREAITFHRAMDMRYVGQSFELTVELPPGAGMLYRID